VQLDEVDRNLLLTRAVEGDVDVTRNNEGVSELSICEDVS